MHLENVNTFDELPFHLSVGDVAEILQHLSIG
jgi:hypothetical protein